MRGKVEEIEGKRERVIKESFIQAIIQYSLPCLSNICFRYVSATRKKKKHSCPRIFTLDGPDVRKSSITILSPDGKFGLIALFGTLIFTNGMIF